MKMIAKIIERSFWFFPLALIITIIYLSIKAINDPSPLSIGLVLFTIYLFPPLLYRVISLYIPVKLGTQKWGPKEAANGWMIAHRIQMIYVIFPFLERMLNSLPGIYSIWLRLWGSKIGKMVYWGPDVVILDRTHLEVGDYNFIGGSTLSAHLAIPNKDGTIRFVVNPITIGSNVFVSTQCNIGPGTKIQDKSFVKIMTQTFGDRKKELI